MGSTLKHSNGKVIFGRLLGYAKGKAKALSRLLCFAVLVSTMLPSAVLSQENPFQEIVKNEVQQLKQTGGVQIGGENVVSSKILPDFYEKREFNPAWTNQAACDELLAATGGIEKNGLQPSDYRFFPKALMFLAWSDSS